MISVPYYPLKRVNNEFGESLNQAVLQVVNSGWFIRGEFCKRFEEEFAAYCGANFCVGVGNGLEALSLILKGYIALGKIKIGDGVVVPSNTFIATWLAVKAAGLKVIPAEPAENNFLINEESVKVSIKKAEQKNIKVAAILAVHLYGSICPMESLKKLANDYGLLLLEDAAQAHGAVAKIGEKIYRAGNLGNAAGFSFYPGKNLGALGDGGAVVSNDEDLINVVRKISNYGSSQKYVHDFIGENSRLDEIQAAVLSVKLKTLDSQNERRVKIAKRYFDEIENDYLRLPAKTNTYKNLSENVYHIFPVHSKFRNELQKYLAHLNIETLVHYPIPPHLQKAFASEFKNENFFVAETLANQELSIPLYPQMTEEEISKVIFSLNKFSPF